MKLSDTDANLKLTLMATKTGIPKSRIVAWAVKELYQAWKTGEWKLDPVTRQPTRGWD